VRRRLLAVETAGAPTGVAVLEGERVLAELEGEAGASHAAALLPAVERALAEARLGLDAIEAFALAIGPGSFTGLRIGLATLKAFALGTGKLLAPVPTLAALAWPLRAPGVTVVACLDARRGELYAAGFRAGADAASLVPAPELPESVWKPEAIAARIEGPCLLAGEGIEAVRDALAAAGRADVRLAVPADRRPRAAVVGVLGARMLARGEGRPAEGVVPRYLRRAEAEAHRTGQALEPIPAGSDSPSF
jgi:tRNA threonylcarbamoyladenosine biosynthesis protein TsaB